MNQARFLRAIRARIRTAAYLRKWVVLGAVIGVISGLGAALFFVALDLGTRFFLGTLVGLTPASPLGESGHPITDAARPWAIPLVVALGGLVSGIIVFRLAPEAEGHGTDAAIAAFHHGARRIRARIPLVKLVASAVTIGSGGSGGREGPTAQIGAGFGSFLARLLDLDARDARIAVSTGMGAGIGAIFRAPLGGAVLAVEIPYREDVEADALVPAFVGSIVAFSIFGAIVGFDPIFGRVAGAGFTDPRQLVYYSLIGLAAGLLGRLYIGSFYGVTRWFQGSSVPRMLRPAIAGFAVGCLGLVVPGVLGTGYGWVQAGRDRTTLLGLPLWVVLILPVAKILATTLSIGSDGSVGVFGPGMVIGGLLGAGIWRLLEPIAPGVPADPSPFGIEAMMALFGSVAHAPLAVMLKVAEMTDSLAMLGPEMLAIGFVTLAVARPLDVRLAAPQPCRFAGAPLPIRHAPDGGHSRRRCGPASLGPSCGRTRPRPAARARLEAADLPGAPVDRPRRDRAAAASTLPISCRPTRRSPSASSARTARSSRSTTPSTTSLACSPMPIARGLPSSPMVDWPACSPRATSCRPIDGHWRRVSEADWVSSDAVRRRVRAGRGCGSRSGRCDLPQRRLIWTSLSAPFTITVEKDGVRRQLDYTMTLVWEGAGWRFRHDDPASIAMSVTHRGEATMPAGSDAAVARSFAGVRCGVAPPALP